MSNIVGFTPGPYFIDPKHPDCIFVKREGMRNGVRAIIGHTLLKLEHFSDEWPNTARLLAAAPDMHAEIAKLRLLQEAMVAVLNGARIVIKNRDQNENEARVLAAIMSVLSRAES
jgi:hypothetical protein